MKCEKCESENVEVVAHTVGMNKSCGALFVICIILGFVLLVFGIAFIGVARNSLDKDLISLYFDKEQLKIWLEENLTAYNQKLLIGIICFAIGMSDILLMLVIKIVTPDKSVTQIIGVCLDCGETWIIPTNLKEFNEDEIFQAQLKRKKSKNKENEVEEETKKE